MNIQIKSRNKTKQKLTIYTIIINEQSTKMKQKKRSKKKLVQL